MIHLTAFAPAGPLSSRRHGFWQHPQMEQSFGMQVRRRAGPRGEARARQPPLARLPPCTAAGLRHTAQPQPHHACMCVCVCVSPCLFTQVRMGLSQDGESDEVKRIFLEGNPYLLVGSPGGPFPIASFITRVM
jgi:hypothetical protein